MVVKVKRILTSDLCEVLSSGECRVNAIEVRESVVECLDKERRLTISKHDEIEMIANEMLISLFITYLTWVECFQIRNVWPPSR